MQAGKLRQRVTVQYPSQDRDSRGQRTGGWRELTTSSAHIKQLNGSELERARQLVATATHRFTLRVRRSFELTTKHRFEFEGRFFNIGNIDNVEEMGRKWVCLVTEDKP